MKNTTIKQLADQGITICLNGGMYEVQKSGKSVTIFKTFGDALEFAGKQIVLGETMVGFNESSGITIDDAIRHLEMMDEEYDLDSYTEDVINMVVDYLKGKTGDDKEYPLPALCDGECGNVYEWKHLNHIDDPNSDEVLKFCRQCAFTFVASMTQISRELD